MSNKSLEFLSCKCHQLLQKSDFVPSYVCHLFGLSLLGGHAEVVHLLVNAGADVDSQDNRKVSCLMAAFRKGHVKVVKWLVKHVMQFPSDQECVRYIATVTDKVTCHFSTARTSLC